MLARNARLEGLDSRREVKKTTSCLVDQTVSAVFALHISSRVGPTVDSFQIL